MPATAISAHQVLPATGIVSLCGRQFFAQLHHGVGGLVQALALRAAERIDFILDVRFVTWELAGHIDQLIRHGPADQAHGRDE